MIKVPLKIFARIKSRSKAGWVCSPIDFIDCGSRAAVDQALSRMVKAGLVRRIARGLYDMPRFNAMLNGYSPPNHDQIVSAIARRDGIRIVHDNIVHANGLGLTNAVPAKLTYLTDGPSKLIKVGGWTLRMKHATPSFMRNAASKSGPVFQALIWLGKNVVKSSDGLPITLRSKLSNDILSDIKKHTNRFPVWMKPVIDHMLSTDSSYA
jgi:hypothetical protein